MSRDEEPPYEVGYKRPPSEHRFKKGQSGNPAGRKRKPKVCIGAHPMDGSLHNVWLEEANKEVTVNINGRPARRTMGRLAIERLYADAAAGKPTAQRIVHAKLTEVERVRRERWKEEVEVSAELWSQSSREFQRQLGAGVTDPVVIPHPDDFIFNKETDRVEIVGPMDEDAHKAAMAVVNWCEPLVKLLDSDEFTEPDVPQRLEMIERLSEWNALLPPRLKQWPKPRFPEDLDGLFPLDFARKWTIG